MIDKFVIRYYTPYLKSKAEQVVAYLNENLPDDVLIELVDHSTLTLNGFDLYGKIPVSIDAHLAIKFKIPYVQVSRVFDYQGNVIGRQYYVPENLPLGFDTCVIDTDIVTGVTIRTACELLNAHSYSVPLWLNSTTELIDIEDLYFDNSIFVYNEMYNYMLNKDVFCKRTSLPKSFYEPIQKIINQYEV